MRHEIVLVLAAMAILGLFGSGAMAQEKPVYFNTEDHGVPDDPALKVAPWKIVRHEPDYGGLWVVAGDLDGDGAPEIVSAENFNEGDVHYTSAVAAQRLDGSVMWTWGDPGIGRKTWHHDVGCQIHDWDGDGQAEVVVAAKGAVVALDGATGKEKTRFAIREDASDCLVFCDLSGKGRPEEVLVKTRYSQIWAYNRAGELLWTVTNPGGQRTAHQPVPVDLDRDGRDEIIAGYGTLNPNGSLRWVYKSEAVDESRGHLDCARVVRAGEKPEDFRIALTCCGADNVALIDGTGKPLWEIPGKHFESLDAGHVVPEAPGPQIVVDVDHQPQGKSPIWVLGPDGAHLGTLTTDYSRHHALVDWDGDGYDDIVVADGLGVFGPRGTRIATLDVPKDVLDAGVEYETSLFVGDMTGDGVPDIVVNTPVASAVFRNEAGEKPKRGVPLGSGLNFTLY